MRAFKTRSSVIAVTVATDRRTSDPAAAGPCAWASQDFSSYLILAIIDRPRYDREDVLPRTCYDRPHELRAQNLRVQDLGAPDPIEIGLTAAIVTVEGEEPAI